MSVVVGVNDAESVDICMLAGNNSVVLRRLKPGLSTYIGCLCLCICLADSSKVTGVPAVLSVVVIACSPNRLPCALPVLPSVCLSVCLSVLHGLAKQMPYDR